MRNLFSSAAANHASIGSQDQINANPISADRSSSVVAGTLGKNRMISRIAAPRVNDVPVSRLAFLFGTIDNASNELISVGFGFQPYRNPPEKVHHCDVYWCCMHIMINIIIGITIICNR